MPVRQRPYINHADLLRTGVLLRRAWAKAPGWNAWSFARRDIWAQRRLAASRC